MTENSGDSKIRTIINKGSEISGSAIGGALGFLAAGPIGAAVGGAAGTIAAAALKKIGSDISDRYLSERERIRAGGVIAIAAAGIKDRLERGDQLRLDSFFEIDGNNRSGAEEIAESVILKAQKEPEEKKIRFLGNLLINICFDASISPEFGHQLLKIAEQLTYRQLCILNLCYVKQFKYKLKNSNYRERSSFSKDLYQVLFECHDLYTRSLINFGGDVAFGPTDVVP